MKIGILTYHRVVNDGSVMQAFCLSKILQTKFENAQVEIIDYRPSVLENLERRRLITRKFPFVKWNVIKKKRQCLSFLKSHVSISPSYLKSDDLDEGMSFIDNQGYDLVFVGSDTGWEFKENGNVPPPPNVYYLPKLTNYKKISFAISSDPVVDLDINSEKSQSFFNAIDGFDLISIRDDATHEFLKKIGIKESKVSYCPDPTIIFDFQKVLNIPVIDHFKKKIGVSISNKNIRRDIINDLTDAGYDVLDFNDPNFGALAGKHNTVLGRLGIHSSLKGLVTDRFHGSIFAMKIGKVPTVFIEHESKWPLPNSKGRDLFTRLNLQPMVHRWDRNGDNGFISKIELAEKSDTDLSKRFNDLAKHFDEFEDKIDSLSAKS